MKVADGLAEIVASDEAHGIKRPAARVEPKPVHRHDTWMLQASGDFGLANETVASVDVVGKRRLHFLEGDLAAEFQVVCEGNLAQPAPGVQRSDAKSGRRRNAIGGKSRRRRRRVGDCSVHVRGVYCRVCARGGRIGCAWVDVAHDATR